MDQRQRSCTERQHIGDTPLPGILGGAQGQPDQEN
jgi:hypothetical protein